MIILFFILLPCCYHHLVVTRQTEAICWLSNTLMEIKSHVSLTAVIILCVEATLILNVTWWLLFTVGAETNRQHTHKFSDIYDILWEKMDIVNEISLRNWKYQLNNICIFVCVFLFFKGPSVAQSNGSAVHSHVSYPGNLTLRGNHGARMETNIFVLKWNILMINMLLFLCLFL